jgi:hypothetical protein
MIILIPIPRKSYDAEQIGKRILGVVCEKCGCPFYYELVRVGTGSSSSARAAQEISNQDLQTQLAEDSDPVACPKCNWINEDMVQKYRQSHYSGCGCLAFGFTAIGTLSSLAIGWFLASTPPPSPDAVRFFYYIAPSIFALFFLGVVLTCTLLRWRVRPNGDFPAAPLLPIGTAQALFKEESTGKFVLARPRDVFEGTEEGRIYFNPGHDQFPPLCVRCLSHTIHAQSESITPTLSLQIPCCKSCSARFDTQACAASFAASFVVLGIGGAVGYWQESYWCPVSIAFLVALFVYGLVAINYPRPWRVLSGKQPFGVVCLRFCNPEYARVVAKHLANLVEEDASEPKQPDRGEFKAMPEY